MRWGKWARRASTTCTPVTRTCGPSSSGNRRQLLQLLGDRAADKHLRIRGRRKLFGRLAFGHRLGRQRESSDKRFGCRQRLAEIGFAEVRPVIAVLAAEGLPVGGCGRDDERIVILKR